MLPLLVTLAFAGPEAKIERRAQRDPEAAIDLAEAWLDHHEGSRHREAVFDALGGALFARAAAIDTVEGWQRATDALSAWPQRQREAAEREGEAAWAALGPVRDVSALEALLARYAEGRVAGPIRAHLARVRLEAAGDDTSALRAVHRAFLAYPTSRDVALEAIARAKRLDFDRAMIAESLPLWATWRSTYAGMDAEPSLLARAITEEQRLVFAQATTPEALLAERDRFDDDGWRERVDEGATRVALGQLWERDFQDTTGWLARYRDRPNLRAIAKTMPPEMAERLAALDRVDTWRCYAVLFPDGPFGPIAEERATEVALREAVAADTPAVLLAFVQDFPDHPAAPRLLQRARDLAWEQAEEAGDPQAYRDFLEAHPEDPRAWQAEARVILLGEAETFPRTALRRVRRAGPDVQEFTVEVLGCDRQRIAGLVQSDFGVWQGMREAQMVAFGNNESERPLDIVVALDLSGSMLEEQGAVREAIRAFSSQMSFRSRPFRVGLVGFSDAFEALHTLSANPTDLEGWIDGLPESAGGIAEDSIGAGYIAHQWLRSSRAERVVVLLTDEPLQVNDYGYDQTLAASSPTCDPFGRTAQCIAACSGESACGLACLNGDTTGVRAWVEACAPDEGASACLDQARGWLEATYQDCGARYGDPAVQRVAATLRSADVRVFVLGPASIQEPDFEHLAQGTGGRWIDVPEDSTDSGPYTAALLDVADELSRQYTIHARVPVGPPPQILAPNARRWLAIGPAAPAPPSPAPTAPPTPATRSTAPEGPPSLSQTLAVPQRAGVLLGAEDDGDVWRSLDGGATWRRVDAGQGNPRRLSAAGPWVCASDLRSLRCATDGGRRWSALGQPFSTPGYGRITGVGPHILLVQGGAQHQLVAVYNRDIATSAVYFPTNVDQFDASLRPHLHDLARALADDVSLLLQVDGHADLRGDVEKNEALARRRADNVARAVRELGGPAGQVLVRSFGERAPIRVGQSASDLAANRRVELTLLRPLGTSACDDAIAQRLEQPLSAEQLGFDPAAPFGP
jgi:outer membrane protein OmpA-like peptidoglycan-associated protein